MTGLEAVGRGPWVTGPPSTSSVYHTDPECIVMERSSKPPRTVSEVAIEFHDLGTCSDCEGDHPHGVSHNGSRAAHHPDDSGGDGRDA